jgi:hypothetical protein
MKKGRYGASYLKIPEKKNFKTDENNKQQLFLLSFYPVRGSFDE